MIKKVLFVVLILVFQGFALFSQGYVLKIKDAVGKPGENITVTIEIINKTPIVAFQLDVPLPKGFEYIPNSCALVNTRSEGHMIQANVVPESRTLRMLAFSLSNTNLKGNEGAVATFILKAPETEGDYKLAVEGAIVADISAKNLLTGSVNGKIKISKK